MVGRYSILNSEKLPKCNTETRTHQSAFLQLPSSPISYFRVFSKQSHRVYVATVKMVFQRNAGKPNRWHIDGLPACPDLGALAHAGAHAMWVCRVRFPVNPLQHGYLSTNSSGQTKVLLAMGILRTSVEVWVAQAGTMQGTPRISGLHGDCR